MTPQNDSDEELLVYADWLLDAGRDVEADSVRAGVNSVVRRAGAAWHYEGGSGVGVGGVGVGGVGGGVGGVGGGD